MALEDLLEGATFENYTIKDSMYIENLKNRTIILNDEITEELCERVIVPLLNFENDSDTTPVTLYIQTVGGSLCDGLVLCNIIDNYKKPLKIIVLGYSLSMGTIILCAGNNNPNVTKYCYPFSYALHHGGSMSLLGEAVSVKDSYEFFEKLGDSVNEYIVANTGITMDELTSNSRKQWYMTAQEMKDKRLIDKIIGIDAE